MVVAEARKLAANLSDDNSPSDDIAFVKAGFETVLSRPPTDAEQAACVEFLSAEQQTLADSGELSTFDAGPDSNTPAATDPTQRARENLIHVLINHTDFVTRR